jgi:NDP-sugar pyrophosphorylase family protein
MLPMAILAGGLSTRLKSLTNKLPKSLLEINGKPFLEWQLKLLEDSGINHVVYCLAHKGDMIRDYLIQRKTDIKIDFSFDGDSQLGTGGAVAKAREILGKNFFVLYGDSYLPINYIEVSNFFTTQKMSALMTITRNKSERETSNVIYEEKTIKLYDKFKQNSKMLHIDYGLSIFNEKVFEDFPKDRFFDLSDVQHQLSIEGNLAGFEVNHRYYEVGSIQGIQDFETYTRGI